MNIPIKQAVDKGVPIPVSAGTALGSFEVGDSLLFPITERSRVANLASYQRRQYGKTFTIRKVDDNNCRIWRIT